MKRGHRKWHKRIWLLLGPILFVLLGLDLSLRPDAPVNNVLPQILMEGQP